MNNRKVTHSVAKPRKQVCPVCLGKDPLPPDKVADFETEVLYHCTRCSWFGTLTELQELLTKSQHFNDTWESMSGNAWGAMFRAVHNDVLLERYWNDYVRDFDKLVQAAVDSRIIWKKLNNSTLLDSNST
jgi:hypothetical protein